MVYSENITVYHCTFRSEPHINGDGCDPDSCTNCAIFDAPNVEYLEKTHYAMYERYRAKKPNTPIVFISKPNYHFDWTAKARLTVIRNTYKRAKAMGDNRVYFIDGRKLFGDDWDICTVDRTHPTDLGFYKMAKKIYAEIIKIDKIFR